MMFFTFALLSIALLLLLTEKKTASILCIIFCLMFAIKEFLWEIHSPDYGYRMPWIQTELLDNSLKLSSMNNVSTQNSGQQL
ncbi:hypothetical protein C7374_102174 [Falsochrobactrum ovis]|uniref:Uncharacterized protein n=1 Tax=Falsochrobactrum ovis TaxID=1293442 RepID=A0A364JXJ2_9HYPH|nr:hypothetical protein C7374_102174 [Falsochrobactrum ovis]